uniref:Neuromedin U receptor 2 n=1 Tax=Nannospalax galili TaxID=1026970 RepID=A0A8C6RJR5_NANGA
MGTPGNVSWIQQLGVEDPLAMYLNSTEEYLARVCGPRRSHLSLPVSVAYALIFLVGVVGNLLVCLVILRHQTLKTPTNYYLFSLAVSDLLVLLLGMPLEVYEMWYNYPFIFGPVGCYFKTALFETVCFASILSITTVSAERYVAIVHPFRAKLESTLKRDESLEADEMTSNIHRPSRKSVTKMLFVLVLVFAICWTPFHVDRLFFSFVEEWTESLAAAFNLIHVVSGVFFYLSSAVNPIIYNLLSRRFRAAFRNVISPSCRWRHCQDQPQGTSTQRNIFLTQCRLVDLTEDAGPRLPCLSPIYNLHLSTVPCTGQAL